MKILNLKTMNKILIIFLLFCSTTLSAVEEISIPEADVMIYDTYYNLNFYHKIDDGSFQKIEINFDYNDGDNLQYQIKRSNKIISREELFLENHTIIHKENIKKNKFIFNNKFRLLQSTGEEEQTIMFEFLNSSISSFYEIDFRKKEEQGGFGSFEEKKDDNIKKWRINDAIFYNTIKINLGENKHIFLFLEQDYLEGFFLPLIDNNIIVSNNLGIFKAFELENEDPKIKIAFSEKMNFFEIENYYYINEIENNKYILIDDFGNNLLNSVFDTIIYNSYFIIGKNEGENYIFLSNLKEFKIENLLEVYLCRTGLEVLTETSAHYYDADLNIIDEFPPLQYILCGTVYSDCYEIHKYKKSPYHIKVISGGMASEYDEIIELELFELSKKYKITFLNGKEQYCWDGNDRFMDNHYGFPKLLKVKKGKKKGIISYEYSKYDVFEITDTINDGYKKKIIHVIPIPTEIEEVLPIKYDSIQLNPKNGLVYFYKKKKIGLFPKHKTVQYDSLIEKTKSFYLFTRKGKKGWLDLNTFEEYFIK